METKRLNAKFFEKDKKSKCILPLTGGKFQGFILFFFQISSSFFSESSPPCLRRANYIFVHEICKTLSLFFIWQFMQKLIFHLFWFHFLYLFLNLKYFIFNFHLRWFYPLWLSLVIAPSLIWFSSSLSNRVYWWTSAANWSLDLR